MHQPYNLMRKVPHTSVRFVCILLLTWLQIDGNLTDNSEIEALKGIEEDADAIKV